MKLTVIICTHNPCQEYLSRTLFALQSQTLDKTDWELIIIDNASEVPVASNYNLAWHPLGRHVAEPQLGLTPARLRGISEARTNLLVFVDDDNLLDPDYLEVADSIQNVHSMLGAWGGSYRGEFEIPPPQWLLPYLGGLAIGEITNDRWSNEPGMTGSTPIGAGLCVRTSVARQYANRVASDSLRKSLGRKGTHLGAGEDGDLAWTSHDMGLGTGRFAALKLTHLIPKERMTRDYIVRLYAGFAASWVVLERLRPAWASARPSRRTRLWEILDYWTKGTLHRQIARAKSNAAREMQTVLATIQP
jgi:glycosyltransferase involved in cell wall biosynthesis